MSYADHPILDAEAYTEDTGARAERMQAGEASARVEILRTFTRSVKLVPSHSLAVPYVRGCDGREVSEPLTDALLDTSTSGEPRAALMLAAEKSQCPYVAAWLASCAKDYAERVAAEVGMARGDSE